MTTRDEDVSSGIVGGLGALIISALMWVGIIGLFRLALAHPETAAKVGAGAFLLLGSYLIVRACVELDA